MSEEAERLEEAATQHPGSFWGEGSSTQTRDLELPPVPAASSAHAVDQKALEPHSNAGLPSLR